MRKQILVASTMACVLWLLQGCGEPTPPVSRPVEPVQEIGEDLDWQQSETPGLLYRDIRIGHGPTPKKGQRALQHYTVWIAEDGRPGQKIDSSYDTGVMYPLRVGMNMAIAGWDEGVSTMQVGGKRQLLIAPELAYGLAGVEGQIPQNATLFMEIELVEIRD